MTTVFPEISEALLTSQDGFTPPGWRIGDLLVGYGIGPGRAAADGTLEEQALACYARMQAFVEQNGGGLENIARVTGLVTRVEDRLTVNEDLWVRLFPDGRNKPAYKVLVGNLPAPQLVQLNVIAVLGATRTRLDVPGVSAQDPTIRIGQHVFTSRVHGTDPATGTEAPGGVGPEAEMAVRNVADLVIRAGGAARDIVGLNAFVRQEAAEEAGPAMEAAVRAVLPAGHRPALHVNVNYIPARFQIMVEGIAHLGGGGR